MDIQVSDNITTDKKKIVIIGRNGSGKSKKLQELKSKYPQDCIFIPSARGVHNMNTNLQNFLQEERNINSYISQRSYVHNADTYFISKLLTKDYTELDSLRENKKHTSEGKNYIVSLNNIIKSVSPQFPDITKENFNIKSTGDYELKISSDGEKQTIVLICAVLSAEENSILLIDEPENGLHNSALKVLFDELEKQRPDCTFVYSTHNVDFAKSREDAVIIYLSQGKKPQKIESDDSFERDLLIEMNGVPKTIMLVEGDDTDKKLYSKIFREYEVRNGGGCGQITNQVNAVREFFDRKDVIGLVDGDNKDQNKDNELSKKGVFSIPLAQHEHLFILPKILQQYLDDIGYIGKKAVNIISDAIKKSRDYGCHDTQEISALQSKTKDIKAEDDIVSFLREYRGKDLIGQIEGKIGARRIQARMINRPNIVELIGKFIKDSTNDPIAKYFSDQS